MILVTRGIVIQKGFILAGQRSESMSLPLKWELPGGKLEPGETQEVCLIRETIEEFGLRINVLGKLEPVDTFRNGKHYHMLPFTCEVAGGVMEVTEHAQAIWCPIQKLFDLDWAPAEQILLKDWYDNLSRTNLNEYQLEAIVQGNKPLPYSIK